MRILGSNWGPHACAASTLTHEVFPQYNEAAEFLSRTKAIKADVTTWNCPSTGNYCHFKQKKSTNNSAAASLPNNPNHRWQLTTKGKTTGEIGELKAWTEYNLWILIFFSPWYFRILFLCVKPWMSWNSLCESWIFTIPFYDLIAGSIGKIWTMSHTEVGNIV